MHQGRAGGRTQGPSASLGSSVPQASHAKTYSRDLHQKLEKHFKMENIQYE
jgi:hypothetical protein